jgi:hypothetical protein
MLLTSIQLYWTFEKEYSLLPVSWLALWAGGKALRPAFLYYRHL